MCRRPERGEVGRMNNCSSVRSKAAVSQRRLLLLGLLGVVGGTMSEAILSSRSRARFVFFVDRAPRLGVVLKLTGASYSESIASSLLTGS
jgi:hypothetical protein